MIPHRPILKGEPIPPLSGAKASKQREFWDMQVGDAKDFFGTYTHLHNWRTLATTYGKKSGKKFTTRTLVTGGEKFVRVWRTA